MFLYYCIASLSEKITPGALILFTKTKDRAMSESIRINQHLESTKTQF